MQITGEEVTFTSCFLVFDPAGNTEHFMGEMSHINSKFYWLYLQCKQEFISAN